MAVNLTKQRRAVLEVVQASEDHPTASEIMERLVARDCKFAYATVYNSLRYLVGQRLISELNVSEGVSRYDGRMEDHHHAVCDVCGKVSEIMVALPDLLIQELQQATGYQFETPHMVIHGRCPDCQRKNN